MGQISRGDQTRLLFNTVVYQFQNYSAGNLFMDAPPCDNLDELIVLTSDKTYWKSLESSIPSHLRGITVYNRHNM